jgi:hypothetical protein
MASYLDNRENMEPRIREVLDQLSESGKVGRDYKSEVTAAVEALTAVVSGDGTEIERFEGHLGIAQIIRAYTHHADFEQTGAVVQHFRAAFALRHACHAKEPGNETVAMLASMLGHSLADLLQTAAPETAPSLRTEADKACRLSIELTSKEDTVIAKRQLNLATHLLGYPESATTASQLDEAAALLRCAIQSAESVLEAAAVAKLWTTKGHAERRLALVGPPKNRLALLESAKICYQKADSLVGNNSPDGVSPSDWALFILVFGRRATKLAISTPLSKLHIPTLSRLKLTTSIGCMQKCNSPTSATSGILQPKTSGIFVRRPD